MPEPSLFSFPEARRRRRTVACLAGEYPPAHDRWREKNMRKLKLLALLALVLLAARVVPTTLPRSSRVGGPGYGLPPADTGNRLLDWISDFLISLVHVERRVDPFLRPLIEAIVQEPLAALIMKIVNMRRQDEGFALAEERALPNEETYIQS